MAQCKCEKCGKTMDEGQFYTYKDGSKTEKCKQCLTMFIDNYEPDTFLWLLKKMDVPYIEAEWNVLRDRAFAKDPYKMNGMSVFGKYLSKMKLNQWKRYSWADTDRFADEARAKAEVAAMSPEELERQHTELKAKLERGEISDAEYRTLCSTEVQYHEWQQNAARDAVGANNAFNENNFMAEEELIDPAAELTKEDKLYLAMKWGRLYKPAEWVEMEKNYAEMKEAFGINDPDTLNSLIILCKTNLKANQAIDCGDVDGFKKLSSVSDSLRKSMKLTALQNKGESNDCVDCVGNLVAFCEEHTNGEGIPRYEIKADRDIVDSVIRDLKEYYKSLVYEDTSLARQIEDYIKKREIADATKRDREESRKKGLSEVQVEDNDYQQHLDMIAADRAADQKVYGEEDEE